MNIEKVKEELQTKDTYSVNHSVKLPGGEILYKRWDFRKIDNHPNLILFTRKDVTYLISLDYNPLTNVYRKERAYIEMKIMILNHPDTEFSLVFVDIDDFKSYNYIFGVEEGDKLLTLMSKFFMNNLVENEIIGEVYADQFILLIPTSKLDEKIFNKLEKELIKNNEKFLYNISVGINKITDRSLSLGEHLNRAYLANRSGKSKKGLIVAHYNEELKEGYTSHQNIIKDLNNGISNKEFTFFLQPIVDSITNKVVSAEALARWIKKDGTVVSPAFFIPLLEKNGYIVRLDEYIREEVFKYISNKLDKKEEVFPISFNVSRLDLSEDNFLRSLEDLVKKYKIPKKYIRIEITESAFCNDELVLKHIKLLKTHGYYIEMDDFGTGYSSLALLSSMPFDLVKLDVKFISSLNTKSEGLLIASSFLANSFHMDIIAEGVETKEQLEILAKNNIHYIQSYYYSKPLPVKDFEQFVNSKK